MPMKVIGLVMMVVGFFIMFFGLFWLGHTLIWLIPLVIGALICGFGWMVMWQGGHGAKRKNKKNKS